MTRKPYPDDITDFEWNEIKPLIEKRRYNSGRKPKYSKREIINAIFYMNRSGCGWRDLPHDFPPWTAVYQQFRRWKEQGLYGRILDTLRKKLRTLLGREEEPSAAIVDSQSVKTTEKRGGGWRKKGERTEASYPCGYRRLYASR